MRKMSMVAAGLLSASLFLSACGSGAGGSASPASGKNEGASAKPAETIKIGWFGPLTGATATDGTHSRDAALLAVEQFNKAGGLNGAKVELVAEDDQGKPEEALKAVQKLVSNDKVVAMVGGAYSGPTKTAAAKIQELKVPMVIAYAVHPEATKAGDYVNRVIYAGPIQGKAMADYAVNDLKKKNVAVLYVDIDYGKTIYGAFKEEAEKLGAKVAIERPFKMGDKDFSSILTAVKAANPDALYVVGYYNEAAAIVKQARETGIQAQLLGVDGFDSPKYLELGKTNTEGSTFTTSFYTSDTRPVVQSFVKAWQDKYKGEPDMLSSQSYDAATVVLEALKKVGADREKLKQAINETKELDGTSGKITFGKDHEVIKPVVFMTVKDGKFQFVKAKTYN
ncbi:ABC transporter substrate-binding protein [Paenibacillus flagellatus]|uniref:ABC transporter substrate-binding protein n=1 Tax=Paenibacillus flagellatus TaxID=2211139 RepID=A0A2V5K781_9BACL|nr:ABC transporter substrate-binding protein [Paenibacillus flagellatus]PYI53794.1 ABC transporter substrate-binding protein [Paenibacillus flagellatus]